MTRYPRKHKSLAINGIAIIGFAKEVPFKNKLIALTIGALLAIKGYNVTAGNIKGTFSYAFWSAKIFGAKTLAVIDKGIDKQPAYIDSYIYIPSMIEKHQQVTLVSSAAIIIGGGSRSLHLAQEFIKQGKPIIAIKNTHGIVENEVKPLGIRTCSIFSALHYILLKTSN